MGYHIGSLEVLKSLQMYDSSDQRSRRFPSVFGIRFPSVFGIGQKYAQHAVFPGRFSRPGRIGRVWQESSQWVFFQHVLLFFWYLSFIFKG